MNRVLLAALSAVLLVGCDEEPPDFRTACEQGEKLSEFALGDGHYGATLEGADIDCGIPPQGGAPYTPYQLRIGGLDQDSEGLTVRMESVDIHTGEALGEIEYVQRFICSNVGESEGYLVTSELHMRYPGYTLEELDGRETEVTLEATNADGDSVVTGIIGFLRNSL